MKKSSHSNWHQLLASEVLGLLAVELDVGLTEAEVALRRRKFGANRIAPRREIPAWRRFVREFHQPLVYLLLAAAGVSSALGQWVDGTVILTVVFINATVGFFQETKAANAIGSLSRLVTTETTVRRDGGKRRIKSEELVPGDIVLLEPGDRVGADLRLIRVHNLRINESALTGESLPVSKHCDPLSLEAVLADRKNLAFAGTLVSAGHGEGVVWATGEQTETGRIAWLISEAVELSTPLTQKIARFSRLLLWAILAVAVATFGFGMARGESAMDMFMSAVALAVGAIPEGLPATITIVLAIGVSRMARRRAIIRQLPAVETLGSTTVICTDKTGTLTHNEMTVREIFAGGQHYEVTGTGHAAAGEIRCAGEPIAIARHPALAECLRAGVLCNDAQFTRVLDGVSVQGDPTEVALLVAGEKGGFLHAETHRTSPLVDAIPFESVQMFRATLHEGHTQQVIYKVGAAERVIERSSEMLGADGTVAPIDRDAIHRVVAGMASRGLRVLALARRHVPTRSAKLRHEHIADGMTFLGLQGMIDPPRAEAITAVRHCQQAGIAVKMITGDHLVTARAIATLVGLQGDNSGGELAAIAGRDLEKISDADLPLIAEHTSVFARVTPEQKLRLVRALQSRSHVVAMTGDGVNDAPALKQADIGIAMGLSGTAVAKDAADMVLADDNFASIEAAVEEGRGVFDNLTKFIVWIIPTNFGEALVLIAAVALGLPLPLLPLQLLWINLTDTLLGLPLAFEPTERNVMRRPPRDPKTPLLTRPLLMRTGLVTFLMLAGSLWIFSEERNATDATLAAARTAVTNVIVLVEIVYLFNCRFLDRLSISAGFFSNPWAFGGAFMMLGAQLLFNYASFLNRVFHTAPVSGASWLRTAIVAVSVFAVVELEKWLRFRRGKMQDQRN